MSSSFETGISITQASVHPTPSVSPEHRVVFRRTGQFMERFSEQIFLFAVIWYLLTQTHSAFQVGIFLACGAVTVALVSPFSGIIAKRYQRSNRLAAMNLFKCILVLIIAGSFYYHFVSIWLLDAAAAILALGGAVYNPIHTAILPNMLTRDRETPAAPEQLWLNMGALAGIMAGGFLYSSARMPLILIISAIFHMIAALLECWFPSFTPETQPTVTEMPPAVTKPPSAVTEPPSAVNDPGSIPVRPTSGGNPCLHSLWKGLLHLTNHRELFFITGSFLLTNLLFWPVLMIVFPYLFKIVFKLSSLEFGLAQGSYWAGVVIGVTVISNGPSKGRLRNALLKDYMSIGFLMLLLALPLLPVVKAGLTVWSVTLINIILAVFLGLATVAVNLRMGAFLQTQLDPDFRDRIWAWFGSMIAVTGSLGFLIGGWLSQTIPIYWLFIGGAMGMGLIIAIMAGLKTPDRI